MEDQRVEQAVSGEDDTPAHATVRRAVAASAMGNCIEWFDFGVFSAGVMTTIIGTVFFPHDSVGSDGESALAEKYTFMIDWRPAPRSSWAMASTLSWAARAVPWAGVVGTALKSVPPSL